MSTRQGMSDFDEYVLMRFESYFSALTDGAEEMARDDDAPGFSVESPDTRAFVAALLTLAATLTERAE